jgi:hypothetical protein
VIIGVDPHKNTHTATAIDPAANTSAASFREEATWDTDSYFAGARPFPSVGGPSRMHTALADPERAGVGALKDVRGEREGLVRGLAFPPGLMIRLSRQSPVSVRDVIAGREVADMASRASAVLCTVLDPRGQPTNVVEPVPLAPRLDTLEGKTVYLIDVGFGGGWGFLEEAVAWFARHMPGVKTVLKHKSGIMFVDEPQMWVDAKANAHAVIFGVGG